MQIFFDNVVLTGTALAGILEGTDEEFRLIYNPLSLDELTKIWSAFQDVGYKLSVGYMVSPVRIDSTPAHDIHDERVVSKETGYYYVIPEEGET